MWESTTRIKECSEMDWYSVFVGALAGLAVALIVGGMALRVRVPEEGNSE